MAATEAGAFEPPNTNDDLPSTSPQGNIMQRMGNVFLGWLVDVPEQRELIGKPPSFADSRIDSIISISEEEFADHIDEDDVRRTGTTVTACAHILTAAIGIGILSLPYAMATFGWILGPILFLVFAAITLFMSQLLADLYIIDGQRQRTYTDMVYTCYGKGGMIALGVAQQANLILTSILTVSVASRAIKDLGMANCMGYGAQEDCYKSRWKWSLVFGVVQLVLSQVPSLESLWWASIVGAIMAGGVAIAIFGAAIAFPGLGDSGIEPMDINSFNATDCGFQPVNYTVAIQEEDMIFSTPGVVWNALNAIGTVVFAYCFLFVLLEVQDTLRSKVGDTSGPTKMMKKAVNISIGVMTTLYMALSIAVFASLGYCVVGDVTTSYATVVPEWVFKLIDVLILAHAVPSFQVWCQPHYEFIDIYAERSERWPRWLGKGWVLRLWYRSLFVIVVVCLAIAMPFFRLLAGFGGAIGFYPASIYFPINCWVKVFQPSKTVRRSLLAFNILMFILSIFMIAASIQLMVYSASKFEFWSAD